MARAAVYTFVRYKRDPESASARPDVALDGRQSCSGGVPNRQSLAVPRASVLDEWLPSGVSSNRHSCRQHERKVSLFTRTRYRYESLKVKEREEGEEVWEFSYYETDAEGKRQRRAGIVASREEYATESALREEPAVRVIL